MRIYWLSRRSLVCKQVQRVPHHQCGCADLCRELENLSDIESAPNYAFERVDIVDAAAVDALFDKYQPEGVIHLAAESHGPLD